MPEDVPPAEPVPPQETPPNAEPPPAATAVANGKLSEETLAAELEQERAARKAAELKAAGLEDDYRRLKDVTPTPAVSKRSWMDGGTFFHVPPAR